ncbi:MAG: DUF2868 domain-containing protein [Rubrivivax sp.]|nr:DUF2868 domain-containing protein [Rubrivivax sp.]
MPEADVRALSLVRACETGTADAALWSPEDEAWAGRLADETTARGAPAGAWLAERARHAVQRIVPRRTSLARLYLRRTGATRGLGLAVLGGFALGIATDLLGAGQRLQLLAAPLWVVVAWNLVVYLWLGLAALRGAPVGGLRRLVERGLRAGRAALATPGQAVAPADAAQRGAGDGRSPEQRFLALWGAAAAPLLARRAAVLLHVAAIMLALGLLAGMYARALVLEYQVGWQSTLLTPRQVHGLVSALLAPASALTGIAVPGPDAVAALRTDASGAPFGAATVAAPGAALPWLHLWAATLAWAVLVPRLVLAASAAAGERLASRRLRWPLDDAYARRLLQGRRDASAAPASVIVLPHGLVPAPEAVLALQAVLAGAGSRPVDLRMAAPTAYGDEEQLAARLGAVVGAAPGGRGQAARTPGAMGAPDAATGGPGASPGLPAATLAWFDLASTPEPQAQGRFVASLRAATGGPCAMLVDESSYRQRMGAGSARLAERRSAWRGLADEAGVGLACIDLVAAAAEPAGAVAARGALEAAWSGRAATGVPAATAAGQASTRTP